MKFALTGSFGTGKSEVCRGLQGKLPGFAYFTEGVRHQIPAFGYQSPYDIVNAHGIGVFEVMNLNSWSVIDPAQNTELDPKRHQILDQSPVTNLAYFMTLRKDADRKVEDLVIGMAKHYASLIDVHIYFPVGVFPLKGDDMRPNDDQYQKELDQNLLEAFKILNINGEAIHQVQSSGIEDRVHEVHGVISTRVP